MPADDSVRNSDHSEQAVLQSGFRYALALTHRRHDAEDLVQQAAFKLLRRYDTISSRSLLFVAIRRLHLDHQRGRNIENTDELEHIACPRDDVSSVDTRLDMNFYLATLNLQEREVLYLHSVEGYTAAEISNHTSRPRGTVLTLLARAKKKLAARFGPRDNSGGTKDGGSQHE